MARRSSSSSHKIVSIYNDSRRGLHRQLSSFLRTRPGVLRHTCVGLSAVEMLEHSNRRSRFSFFNIEMMETLRHRESTRGGRRGDCPRGRRAGPEAAVLLSGGYPLREKLGGSEQGKANDRRGAACMAARKTSGPKARPIFLPIYRQLDACDLACGAGRSASPNRPPSFRSAALELSASCVREGFPPPGRRGRV